ncbi:MAG: hypothetical protein AAFN77_19395 [Planctomycetota bacterium]
MRSLKEILQETGSYQEPPTQKAEVPPRQDPPKREPERWTTLGEVIEDPGEFSKAWANWAGRKVGKLLKDFWNGIVARLERLVGKCRV